MTTLLISFSEHSVLKLFWTDWFRVLLLFSSQSSYSLKVRLQLFLFWHLLLLHIFSHRKLGESGQFWLLMLANDRLAADRAEFGRHYGLQILPGFFALLARWWCFFFGRLFNSRWWLRDALSQLLLLRAWFLDFLHFLSHQNRLRRWLRGCVVWFLVRLRRASQQGRFRLRLLPAIFRALHIFSTRQGKGLRLLIQKLRQISLRRTVLVEALPLLPSLLLLSQRYISFQLVPCLQESTRCPRFGLLSPELILISLDACDHPRFVSRDAVGKESAVSMW